MAHKILFLLLVAICTPAWAQNIVETTVSHLSNDVVGTVVDPHTRQLEILGLSTLVGGFVGTYLTHRWLDDNVSRSSSNTVLPGTKLVSSVGGVLPYTMPFAFFGASRLFSQGSLERAKTTRVSEELAESLVLTMGLTGVLKYGVGRTRPNGGKLSFPSAHTSMAFSQAGILAAEYPWYVGVPSLMVASGISWSRLDLKAHFASDVCAGAAIGLLFSEGVYAFHRTKHLSPVVTRDTIGISWQQLF